MVSVCLSLVNFKLWVEISLFCVLAVNVGAHVSFRTMVFSGYTCGGMSDPVLGILFF